MLGHYIILNCILSALSATITNVTDVQDSKIYRQKHIQNLELNAEEPSEEFMMTKLLDIHLKGGYDQSRTDLRDVFRSQIQPDLGFNHDSHSSRVHDENCPDVHIGNKFQNNYDFLIEKLENITTTQSSLNAELDADCKSLVGVDETSRCKQHVSKKHMLPKSCKEIKLNGQNVSGIYEIQPKLSKKPFMVLCDMETMDGGWVHIQRRLDGSQDFYLGWREYKFGFGNLNGEFWLGLENIYVSTASEASELLVELVDRDNVKAYAHYKAFAIGSEVEGYPLSVLKDCSGDAGDALIHHLGEKFTTKDYDQDKHASNCAVMFSGAWWYKSCHLSNLNGKYLNSVLPEQYKYHGLHWNTFRSHEYCHARARMLIRPA